MDGTLIESTSIWSDIDKEFFAKRGISHVPSEYAKEIVHLGLLKGAEMTIQRYNLINDTVEGVVKEWTDASIDQYLNKIPLKDGALELLNYLKTKDVVITLATANNPNLYEPCLERLKIRDYFETITDVNKTKEGKSSPKIYDSICEKYGVKRDETLIIEDTLVALKTAFTNGFNVVAVDDFCTRNIEKEKRDFSHEFVYSLKELIK